MLLLNIWLRVFSEIVLIELSLLHLDQLLISCVYQNTESVLCVLTHTCPMKIIQRYSNSIKIIIIFFILCSKILHKHQRWTQELTQRFSRLSTNDFWYLSKMMLTSVY